MIPIDVISSILFILSIPVDFARKPFGINH